jgi:hypothetical protein
MIKDADGFKKRTDLPKPYGFYMNETSSEPILADTEEELIKKVYAQFNNFED